MESKAVTCPNCGGILKYDIETRSVVCVSCKTPIKYEQGLSILKHLDDINVDADYGQDPNHVKYHCDTCGGDLELPKNTTSSKCPFCGNNLIIKEELFGETRPRYIIPYTINKDMVKQKIDRYLAGNFFLPFAFRKQYKELGRIIGIYTPYWLFSADGDCPFTVSFKDTPNRFNFLDDQPMGATMSRRFVGHARFEKIPIDGLNEADDILTEGLEPFDSTKLVPFNPLYLTGFLSKSCDVEFPALVIRFKDRLQLGVIDQIKKDYEAQVGCHATNFSYVKESHVKATYALLPVWYKTMEWKGVEYKILVNGQTGKVMGKLPVSKPLVCLNAIIFMALIQEIVFWSFFGMTHHLVFSLVISLLLGILFGIGLSVSMYREYYIKKGKINPIDNYLQAGSYKSEPLSDKKKKEIDPYARIDFLDPVLYGRDASKNVYVKKFDEDVVVDVERDGEKVVEDSRTLNQSIEDRIEQTELTLRSIKIRYSKGLLSQSEYERTKSRLESNIVYYKNQLKEVEDIQNEKEKVGN